MKQQRKLPVKIISVLLSIILALLSLPLSVFAIEENDSYAPDNSDFETVNNPEAECENEFKNVFEVIERREEFVKHFKLDDGSYTAVQYDVPIHYLDENAKWQDIDNTLSVLEDNYSTSNSRIKFAKRITGNETLFTIHDGNRKITMSLDGSKKNTFGSVTNTHTEFDEHATQLQKMMTLDKLSSRTLYADILDDVDLEYVVESVNVKENIIVKGKQDSYSYTFTIQLNNLNAVLNEDGSVSIFDWDSEETVYVIPAPIVYDTNSVHADPGHAQFDLVRKGTHTYALTVTVDANWMNAEDRAFPVTIDPTVFTGSSVSMTDTYVDSLYPTYSYYDWCLNCDLQS